MGTTKTATARALISPEAKSQAEAFLKETGLSISNSVELFYWQVVAQRGLPFDLEVPNEKPYNDHSPVVITYNDNLLNTA
jgi:DNA-damage-inducible protein J